ncbi:MAG: 3-deoxy-D-manno-octulosonic acid transferase [Gemmataceae bacterium]
MRYLLNCVYLLAFLFISPWLIYKALTKGKYREGFWTKFFGLVPCREGLKPCVWFHGVSVGEIILLRKIVAAFRMRHPEYDVVVSTTTNTGMQEAKKHFSDLCVFYWPFDFTWAIQNVLRRIRPQAVILAESELWPNFLSLTSRNAIKVGVINGRMSPRSARRYHQFGLFAKPILRNVDLWAVQTPEHQQHLQKLGLTNVFPTGSIKYDGTTTDRNAPATESFRKLFGINPDEPVLIAGSTYGPEEEILLDGYPLLLEQVPNLCTILVPRHKERFDEVAQLIRNRGLSFSRRSEMTNSPQNSPRLILVDTIGELGAIWGLADVAFVGGSLDGKRGGQNMLEPAAFGAAVIVGPHVWNFRRNVEMLLTAGGLIQVTNQEALFREMHSLLTDRALRHKLGTAAQQFVLSQQGALARTLDLLDEFLSTTPTLNQAA